MLSSHLHLAVPQQITRREGGGTPLYKPYRNVPPQRVGF